MLRLPNSLLSICQQIKNNNIEFKLQPGCRLARGFADLGFEEFLLLEGDKLISLYRGSLSEFLPEESKHFFRIPTLTEIQAKIYELGFDINIVKFEEQRKWILELLNCESQKEYKFEELDLETLFLKALRDVSNS